MIVWCDKPELKIYSDTEPCTAVLKPLPSDSKTIKQDKKLKPFINKKRVLFDIDYLGSKFCILIPKNYRWNGTNCIGLQFYPKLLNASMLHDIICENHSYVGGDRQLSSMIFREMGIASDMNPLFMKLAYHCVDNFQKIFGKDSKGFYW